MSIIIISIIILSVISNSHEQVMSHKNESFVCLVHTSHYMRQSRERTAGWQRPIECLKLQVSFRKRATNHRALLHKSICKDQASYGSWSTFSTLYYWHMISGSFVDDQWFFCGKRPATTLNHCQKSDMPVSPTNESCLTWRMRHVSHEWAMSHTNESCLTRMSHVSSRVYTCQFREKTSTWYGVATSSRLLKIIPLFCRRAP